MNDDSSSGGDECITVECRLCDCTYLPRDVYYDVRNESYLCSDCLHDNYVLNTECTVCGSDHLSGDRCMDCHPMCPQCGEDNVNNHTCEQCYMSWLDDSASTGTILSTTMRFTNDDVAVLLDANLWFPNCIWREHTLSIIIEETYAEWYARLTHINRGNLLFGHVQRTFPLCTCPVVTINDTLKDVPYDDARIHIVCLDILNNVISQRKLPLLKILNDEDGEAHILLDNHSQSVTIPPADTDPAT